MPNDLSFFLMPGIFARAGLPSSVPPDRVWHRTVGEQGETVLHVEAPRPELLPHGNVARLILAQCCTHIFMDTKQKYTAADGAVVMKLDPIRHLKNRGRVDSGPQRRRFFTAVRTLQESTFSWRMTRGNIPDGPDRVRVFSEVDEDGGRAVISPEFAIHCRDGALPVQSEVFDGVGRSALGIDLACFFMMLSQKQKIDPVLWRNLFRRFGNRPDAEPSADAMKQFRERTRRSLQHLMKCWPTVSFDDGPKKIVVNGTIPRPERKPTTAHGRPGGIPSVALPRQIQALAADGVIPDITGLWAAAPAAAAAHRKRRRRFEPI